MSSPRILNPMYEVLAAMPSPGMDPDQAHRFWLDFQSWSGPNTPAPVTVRTAEPARSTQRLTSAKPPKPPNWWKDQDDRHAALCPEWESPKSRRHCHSFDMSRTVGRERGIFFETRGGGRRQKLNDPLIEKMLQNAIRTGSNVPLSPGTVSPNSRLGHSIELSSPSPTEPSIRCRGQCTGCSADLLPAVMAKSLSTTQSSATLGSGAQQMVNERTGCTVCNDPNYANKLISHEREIDVSLTKRSSLPAVPHPPRATVKPQYRMLGAPYARLKPTIKATDSGLN
mmetsp:Transcript_18793/g.33257  ORF Transcript_18793/g.33257 Transcript_18793/m.33257 type:complete len:283 (-) Transcript_18793:304-1152(-)